MKAVIETFKDIPDYEGLYQVSNYGCVRSLKFGNAKYLKNMKNQTGYERICLSRDGKTKHFFVHRLVWETFVGPIPEGMEIDHINTIRDDNRLVNLRVVTRKENYNNPITAERHKDANQRLAQDPKWIEATREANQRKAKDPKWIEATREAGKRRAQDPKWIEATREAGKRRAQDPQWLEANREANRRLAKDPKWREATREANRKTFAKPILQLDKQTGEVIRCWECARDVERELGINNANISACCLGKRNSAGGYRWSFA